MTYKEVQEFLFSQLPMYQRQGVSAFKKNLDNIIALCELLDNPQNKFRSIHLAGTNGKGSTSHMIAAGLQANGYRVGLYTSPHYKDYRERIKINGEFISKDEVINFVEDHKEDFLRIQPSFFEITVAMAFAHFAKQNVDVAIIETGLGGRLDSTNIINPILSIITNISFDHQSMLGNNLEQIAGEKAGIIKTRTPVIIGEYQDEINHVFVNKTNEAQSIIYQADLSSKIIQTKTEQFNFQLNESDWSVDFKTTMASPFQLKNLGTALFSLWTLKEHFQLDPIKIAFGLENINRLTYYIGRWMIIQHEPLVIFDSAHNEAGITHLVKEIANKKYQNIHFVFGTAADKDLDTILSILPKAAIYYFAKADIPRGMTTDVLQDLASQNGLNGLEYPSVAAAYKNAISSANKDDIVIVAGSIFVVAEVL
jgi:dihydrofolate synthase/folylpolyglutamate synthase